MLLASCQPSLPQQAEEADRLPQVLPDNNGATLPPNIAPLNFEIQEEGDAFVTRLSTKAGEELLVSGRTIDIALDDWQRLLSSAVGDTLWTDVYVREDARWKHYNRMANPVVADSIDPFITYRLIRPSYVMYEELSLVERSTENFDERIIYNNMPMSKGDKGQCINCHVPQQQGQGGHSQFHVRHAYGGTVFIDGKQAQKINLKTDSTLSAGVYPAWHPTLNLIAYSVNETGQSFHTLDPQKIEVIDYASDLILYDMERNEVTSIERTVNDFESFPTWSPDGRTLYYISAHHELQGESIDADLDQNYQSLHYNIYARDFDATSCKFGARRLVFDAEAIGKSASTPRVSPDGCWLLFSLADYGQFHIWHRNADLCVIPLQHPEHHEELKQLNSSESDSYHSWSSNGRWILFSSRRMDGNYTRLYLSYFDASGHAHHPLLLPQQSPVFYDQFFRSYNAAEWMTKPFGPDRKTLHDCILQDARQAKYVGSALLTPETNEASSDTKITKQNYHNIYENN